MSIKNSINQVLDLKLVALSGPAIVLGSVSCSLVAPGSFLILAGSIASALPFAHLSKKKGLKEQSIAVMATALVIGWLVIRATLQH